MKKITLFLFIITLTFSLVHGQYGSLIYTDTINFETSHNWVHLDTSITNNIWRIGIPSKTYLDSAYSIPYAIITDTINSYPINNYSYFDIIIDDDSPGWWMWGEGIISFWHKYDTDSLKDGEYIEVSYDGGNSWMNIINDSLAMETSNINFYTNSDTILGNIPAFSGHSGGWIYSEFYWFWNALVKEFPQDSLIVRFIFKSDSIQTNKEGWLIDNIVFNGYEIIGDISYITLGSEKVKLYPNPVKDFFTIEFSNPKNDKFILELFDNLGKQIMKKKNIKTDKINISKINLDKGIYYFKLFNDDEIHTGKILID